MYNNHIIHILFIKEINVFIDFPETWVNVN